MTPALRRALERLIEDVLDLKANEDPQDPEVCVGLYDCQYLAREVRVLLDREPKEPPR